ncbi:MAG: c-type cytochrome [Planctomycetaceae bacterium]|jgi:YVTN family beta-propeller protein|nr:c-type cytochrome [Planctomycetaceae bacterium]
MNKHTYKPNLATALFVVLLFWGVLQSYLIAETVPSYKGPLAMVTSKDATKIYIANHDGNEIGVFDVGTDKIVNNIPLGKKPNGLILGVDGKTLYATSGSYRGVVQAIDLSSGKITKEVETGHTPTDGVVTPDGKKLYVCNRFSTDVSEFDLPELKLVRKIKAVREPRGAVVTPDGKKVYVINGTPNDVNNVPEDENARIIVSSLITVIDVPSGTTTNIRLSNGSGSLHGVTISPDGRYVFMTEILARFQVPTTHLERGWVNTSGISIIDTTKLSEPNGGFLTTILLDDVYQGAANPWGITISADGKLLCVAIAGTSEIITINIEKMIAKITTLKPDSENPEGWSTGKTTYVGDVTNDLAFLVDIKKRIKVNGKGARPVVMIGNYAYVGMYFSDTVQKVDVNTVNAKAVEIPIGAKPNLTAVRRGEIYWHDASMGFCFQSWHSCASCHPDGRMDAYNWDLLNDGMGNPKNAKSLVWCQKTPPAMWTGVRATSAVCTRTGFQYILFVPPDEVVCKDIDEYVHSLEPELSPYLVNGKLSEKAERGKKIFEDKKVGCVTCHPAPLFTDKKLHDVNSKVYFDHGKTDFDTPTLVEIWRTGPYLHDGRYTDLKDVFKKGKHGDVEGDIESLTDQQLDDLVEYLLSL